MSRIFLPMFSFRILVLGLIFKSLMCLELIFIRSVRQGSNFMFLHSNIQFSQQHLLKRLLFLHYMFLAPLPKVRLPRINRFTSGLYPVLLAYGPVSMQVSQHFDYYSFIVWLEIRQCDAFCGFIQMYSSFCFVFFPIGNMLLEF